MGEDAKLFTDGQAYERLMGRWSRIAAETFLRWLDVPKNLMAGHRMWQRRFYRGADSSLRPTCGTQVAEPQPTRFTWH